MANKTTYDYALLELIKYFLTKDNVSFVTWVSSYSLFYQCDPNTICLLLIIFFKWRIPISWSITPRITHILQSLLDCGEPTETCLPVSPCRSHIFSTFIWFPFFLFIQKLISWHLSSYNVLQKSSGIPYHVEELRVLQCFQVSLPSCLLPLLASIVFISAQNKLFISLWMHLFKLYIVFVQPPDCPHILDLAPGSC